MISGILAIVFWGLNFLVFDSTESEPFTLMDTAEPLTIEFPFINQGANSLEITSVTTSCGCLTASWPKELLASGERGVITLVFDPRNQSGEIFREAFVYTSDSSEIPVAELHVRGKIVDSPYRGYPVKMGELRLKTRDVRFGKVAPGTKAVERIECVNTGSQPLSISILPGFAPPWISLQPIILPPGVIADLVIIADMPIRHSEAADVSRHSLKIILEGPSCAPSARTLNVIIL